MMKHHSHASSTVLLLSLTLSTLSWAHGDMGSHQPVHKAHTMRETPAEQTAWGIAGQSQQVQRTITLTMGDDMRFTPNHLQVTEGETVRIQVRNTGKMLHEIVIGTPSALAEHAALMMRFPNMEHSEAYMAHVPPAQQGSIVWTFNRLGDFEFACLIAGHYQAGMRGSIQVLPAAQQTTQGN